MEKREDLSLILPYLPLVIRSSSLVWPPQVVETLETLSKAPIHSRVDSGEALSRCIANIRKSLSLNSPLVPFALQGYALLFDQKMSKEKSARWFSEVIPALANLLLRLPSLLETHYQNADNLLDGIKTGLRILGPQEAGVVFLSQELIAALLACSFFCFFPETNRDANRLQGINFDDLLVSVCTGYSKKQENKILCIIHYFERIYSCVPTGFVSFERKVLGLEYHPFDLACPEAHFWSKSATHLCPIEVHTSGLIEDRSGEALEVDFADAYLGGIALRTGCLQEEIRFMINPELIAGMLFLPSMDDNEAIEIVGVERFSRYTGYASSFQFAGDYVDKRDADMFGRRKTRIIAIDAMNRPGMRQYRLEGLLREINKAFCGFMHSQQEKIIQKSRCCEIQIEKDTKNLSSLPSDLSSEASSSTPIKTNEEIGIATGNWGCGVFKGDPEVKTIIQWLAASQAERPFMSYYTFGLEALNNLDQVTKMIVLKEWRVGDLWNKLVDYSSERSNGKTRLGFFFWLFTSPSAYTPNN